MRPVTSRTAWERLADALEADIRAGVYPLGGELPSFRQLEHERDVSQATVDRALSELVRRGLVVREPYRVAMVVRVLPAPAESPRSLEERVAALEARVDRLEGDMGGN